MKLLKDSLIKNYWINGNPHHGQDQCETWKTEKFPK